MPLTVSTTTPTLPLTIQIDDEPVRLHIKRLTKAEVLAFRIAFFHFGQPRGTADSEDLQAAREREANAFIEQSITNYVAFEAGDVVGDDGRPIVTGAAIVEAFYARVDVLTACYQAIYSENCLGKAQKKILKSLRVFEAGSTPSSPAPAGDAHAPTAHAAGSSTTAASGAATDATAGASSGGSGGATKVH